MDESRSNIIGSLLFVVLILFLAIGGFFLTKNLTQDKDEKKEKTAENIISDKHKIDKDKDYIYYTNDKFISMEPDITYQDVVINLVTAETLNSTLKNEMVEIRNSVKYISDVELDPNRTIMYDGENIYSALERNYETHNYKEYMSLIVKDYEFNCYDGSLLKSVKSYVYNLNNGKMLLSNDLLSLYETDMDKAKGLIREKIISDQKIDEETGTELILVEDTINSLNNSSSYAIYIDKYGDLYISFIVKTTQVDYNENIKLN